MVFSLFKIKYDLTIKEKVMRYGRIMIITLMACLLAGSYLESSWAGVSAEEAKQLKSTLTPFGALRAGNADGTIPAWKGGYTQIPDGFEKNRPHIDPFADDKPLFTITAANMEQYAENLSAGQKGLLKKFPDTYSLKVYPTRRSHAAPDWVYENTFKNATRAEITEDGLGVTNAFGGIIFPIPKSAEEVMWNFLSRWRGSFVTYNFDNIIIPGSGKYFISSSSLVSDKNPLYDRELGFEGYNAQEIPIVYCTVNQYTGPPRKKGEIILAMDPLNLKDHSRLAWQYLPGQRRVRRAPTVSYDTPNTGAQGLMTYDDVYMYNGCFDRYDWKLIGKKECYIPYNCYQQEQKRPIEEMYPANHPNPEYWRWELHRVWVVEATLKEGKRHVYAKRVFYLDEDSWMIPMRDIYDAQGSLWRTAYNALKNAYELPGVVEIPTVYIDFYTPEYIVNQSPINYEGLLDYDTENTADFWSPENIRRLGKR